MRPLRLEEPGAVYHVLNRGNYRASLFRDEGAKVAFLRCLDQACAKTGWVVHAWCVMTNHYHLALSTPKPNLVEGMQWLQSTFAKRFNRLRRENGHLFQGRYKSLIVDPGEGLGPLCHYIHLNPVRAGLCTVTDLGAWPWSSMAWVRSVRRRPAWFDPSPALDHAGGLKDSSTGRRQYLAYLGWLAEDEPARKALKFDRMSRGWVLGSKSFKADLLKENRRAMAARELGEDDEMAAAREVHRQGVLTQLLRRIGRTRRELKAEGKFAAWKVAVAATMKARTTVTNRWLSEQLAMGSLHEVSRQVSAWLRQPDPATAKRMGLTTNYKA